MTKFNFASLLVLALASGHVQAADPTFTNVAHLNGLAYSGSTWGDQPVFAYRGTSAIAQSHHGKTWPVLNRQGPRWVPVASVLPQGSDGHGCSAADVTNPALTGRDGLIDLICTKGGCHGTCGQPFNKELWVQRPEGGFVNLAASTPMQQPHSSWPRYRRRRADGRAAGGGLRQRGLAHDTRPNRSTAPTCSRAAGSPSCRS